jgi:hypothetical protein
VREPKRTLGELAPQARAHRRVIAAIHLLGITAYAVPWLLRVDGASRLAISAAVLVLGITFATWTGASRRPTVVSVLGAILMAAAIGLGPAVVVTRRLDALLPVTPQIAMMFVLAIAFGVLSARPAVRARAYDQRPSFAAADRSGARAGAWLALIATPPLAFAAYLLRAAPHAPEAIFGVVIAAAIVLFGIIVSIAGSAGARGRKEWLAQVRRGEIPGYRLRPRIPTDPELVAFDDVASVRSAAVLEACAKAGVFQSAHSARAIALAPLD